MHNNQVALRLCVDARFAHNHFPGIGRVVSELITAWATHPAVTQLHIIVNPRHHNTFFTLPSPSERIHYHHCDAPPFGLRESWCMRQIVTSIRPDWIYIPHFWHPWVPLAAPIMTTIHDLIPLQAPHQPWYRRAVIAWLITRAVRHSRIITTVSTASAHQLRDFMDVPELHVINNGFRPFTASTLPPVFPAPYLLCVSSNQPHKNLIALHTAWHDALQQHLIPAHAQLVIAGRMDARYEVPTATASFHVIDSPDDPTLAALYQHAQGCVFPSLMEGFGLPLLEALAHQLPTLCDDHVALHAHLQGHVQTCDMRHVPDITHAIGQLWQYQPEPLPHTWLDYYRWETQAQRYLELMIATP